jgi:mRNA interferase HigB
LRPHKNQRSDNNTIMTKVYDVDKILLINFPIWENSIIFAKTYLMRVISKKILREFWEKHKNCEEQLKSWYKEAENAHWRSPNDIKLEYPSASILQSNRVIFNIKGNTYRLIVKINYDFELLWIRFIGTHAEYNKINADTV